MTVQRDGTVTAGRALGADGVRPLAVADLPAVEALLARLDTSPRPFAPSAARRERLRRLLIDSPWADPDMPSLVYGHGGRPVAFLGAHPRPLEFRGRRLRALWSGPLVGAPDNGLPAGPLLLRSLLAGPQDATITDGANAVARRLWERLGGRVAHVRSLSWWRVLRPWRGAGELWARHRETTTGGVRDGVLSALDALTPRAAGFRPREPDALSVALDPAMLIDLREAAPTGDPRVPLDRDGAAWLLDRLGHEQRLVLGPGGETAGWYVARLPPGGVARLVGLGARPDAARVVLDRLLRDAWDAGCALVTGRAEPSLLPALADDRRTVFSPGPWVLVHARDPGLAAALVAGEGSLSRLDGEWWCLSHVQGDG